MKKSIIIATMFTLATAAIFADRVVHPDSIPPRAKSFISQYFSGRSAQYVEADFNEYEVHLNDGTEIQFTGSGDWHEIKSYMGIPAGVLPPEVGRYAAQVYPNVPIIEAKKEWRGYELKLANRMEMYFDNSGRFLGQKFDD